MGPNRHPAAAWVATQPGVSSGCWQARFTPPTSMPTARYGDEARQSAIRSEGGAVQASNPGPAKLPGDTGTAAAALTAPGTAAARVPSATADGAGYAAAVAARIPPSRAVSDER